jgi:hypothetical protein
MPRPSIFIVGHSKSGTTALASFLSQHPDVFFCDPMEPNYFCPAWCRADGPPSHFFPRTEQQYLALFSSARANQRCGEASASYLYSPEAAGRIHAFEPDARIIMIFREPVEFLRSYHLQLLRNVPTEGESVTDLREAIRLEPDRRRGRSLPPGCVVPELLRYTSDRLAYADHYDRFAEFFPDDRLLALVYDDFRRENSATVRRVVSFLELEPFEPRLGEHNVGGSALRSRRAERWLRRATHAGGAAAVIRRRLPLRLRRRAVDAAFRNLVLGPAPPLDDELAAEIRARARPQVEALSERVGRDLLTEWGYRSTPAAELGAPV